MNKFKPNKKAVCVLCKKSTGERPRYGVTPGETVCEVCWEKNEVKATAALEGKHGDA